MLIVDSQVHLWGANTPERPWPAAQRVRPQRDVPLGKDELLRDTSDSYPFRWLHPYLRQVYDAFGPKRMFWGSDLSRLPCSYKQGLTYMSEEIPWLTAEDKEWILGRGVCEWLQWKLP